MPFFTNTVVVKEEATKSDHCPIIVDIEYLHGGHTTNGPKACRLEGQNRRTWRRWYTLHVMVLWHVGSTVEPTLMQKMTKIHEDLHAWDRRELRSRR
jgi:hypothetical protein